MYCVLELMYIMAPFHIYYGLSTGLDGTCGDVPVPLLFLLMSNKKKGKSICPLGSGGPKYRLHKYYIMIP